MVGTILEKGKVVTPIDVLVGMQLLNRTIWKNGVAGGSRTLSK